MDLAARLAVVTAGAARGDCPGHGYPFGPSGPGTTYPYVGACSHLGGRCAVLYVTSPRTFYVCRFERPDGGRSDAPTRGYYTESARAADRAFRRLADGLAGDPGK